MTKYILIKSVAHLEDGDMPYSDAMIAHYGNGTFSDCLKSLELTTELIINNGGVLLDEYDESYSAVKQYIRYFACHNSKKDWIETWSIKPFTV